MEMKFYRCSHCGQIIAIVKETGVPVVCCGEPMAEVIPGTTDASLEKHVPVFTVEGNKVHVSVGLQHTRCFPSIISNGSQYRRN